MGSHTSLDREAQNILRQNDRGGYTVPTDGLYPYQWNWDSVFAALGFSTFDLPRAWQEIHTLITGQWDNGMVPHILFHQDNEGYYPGPEIWGCNGPIPSSGISQPPVAATFVRRIYEGDPETGRAHLEKLFKPMQDWHRWFMTWRLDRGAVCVTHPWESGRDNAPDWDGTMERIDPVGVGEYKRRDTSHVSSDMRPTKFDYDRYIWLVQLGRRLGWDDAKLLEENPFRVADPTMTFILLRASRDLAALADVLGAPRDEIDGWISTLETGAASLWNDKIKCFDGRDAITGDFSGSISNASFLCWYAGIHSDEMLAHLHRITASCAYGVPSLDPRDPRFDAKRYWRGPVWGMMNTMIGTGLAEMGYRKEADALATNTADLISRHGFAEYFDPSDGTPAGGGVFTWTAAIWLAWASPSARAV